MKALLVFMGLALPFIFLGCSSDGEWMSNVDKEGYLLLNYQSMVRASEDHLFLEVKEIDDNRCPIGVVCPENGIANIVFKARLGDEEVSFILQSAKLQNDIKISEIVFNHTVEVMDLSPYPYCSEPLEDKRGYIVKLKVEPIQ
jgi:hypothetical protein